MEGMLFWHRHYNAWKYDIVDFHLSVPFRQEDFKYNI